MITSVEELVERAYADPVVAGVLASGDWYLIGSHTFGAGDELSDWDTVLLTADDDVGGLPDDVVDAAFGVVRPEPAGGVPDLDLHVRFRGARMVDIEVLGPSARAERESSGLAEWAFQLGHAVPLGSAGSAGERYRREVLARFEVACAGLAAEEYARFRRGRNAAVATLPRNDPAAQALTAGVCVGQAARFWLLALGLPYPSDKWLLHELARVPGAEPVLAALRACLDQRKSAASRFDAFWTLWRLVDDHLEARR